jgi:hypothetical protein
MSNYTFTEYVAMLNESKELTTDKYFEKKFDAEKIANKLKDPAGSVKLNSREKEVFEGWRDIFTKYAISGKTKYTTELTQNDADILKHLGIAVFGKSTDENGYVIYKGFGK